MLFRSLHVKLYSRAFENRISSNSHCIFVRTEYIIKNRVRLQPFDKTYATGDTIVEDTDTEEEENSNDNLDSDQRESYEPDSGFDDEDNSADGSRRTVNRRNGLMLTPLLQAPGAARRARMVNVAVQTSPPNNAADNRDGPH